MLIFSFFFFLLQCVTPVVAAGIALKSLKLFKRDPCLSVLKIKQKLEVVSMPNILSWLICFLLRHWTVSMLISVSWWPTYCLIFLMPAVMSGENLQTLGQFLGHCRCFLASPLTSVSALCGNTNKWLWQMLQLNNHIMSLQVHIVPVNFSEPFNSPHQIM